MTERIRALLSTAYAKKILFALVVILAACLLTLSFFGNVFDVADVGWFDTWQADSEAFVWGRIIRTREAGLWAESGFLQRAYEGDTFAAFVHGADIEEFQLYVSQIGLQGMGFGFLDRILPLSGYAAASAFRLLNVLLFVGLILMLARWAVREFHWLAGVFIVAGCMFSPWLVVAARNLYWAPWTMLLPFIAILYLHWLEQRRAREIRQWIYFGAAFLTMFIRAGSGLEFFTAILISIELPTIFYGIRDKWDIRRYLRRSVWIGLGGGAAVVAAIGVNLWQRIAYSGSFATSVRHLLHNAFYRTGLFDQGIDIAAAKQDSLEAPLAQVIHMYLHGGRPLVLNDRMGELLLILAICAVCLFASTKYLPRIAENRRTLAALAVMTGVGVLAPISWIVMARGHSYIHTHINHVLWHFPGVMLLFALCGVVVAYGCKGIWDVHRSALRRTVLVICAAVLFVWPFYQFYQVWEWGPNMRQVRQAEQGGEVLYQGEAVVIFYYDHALYYSAEEREYLSPRFFLHAFPADGAEAYNLDFYFESARMARPFWEARHTARIQLPDGEITHIATGQFEDTVRLWEAYVELPGRSAPDG